MLFTGIKMGFSSVSLLSPLSIRDIPLFMLNSDFLLSLSFRLLSLVCYRLSSLNDIPFEIEGSCSPDKFALSSVVLLFMPSKENSFSYCFGFSYLFSGYFRSFPLLKQVFSEIDICGILLIISFSLLFAAIFAT